MADREHARIPFEAYRGEEAYCFVSYAHAEAEVVYPELVRLREMGFNVWYDEGISPGHLWSDELAERIENCGLFLLFVSPGSVASDHCMRETQFAIGRKRPLLAVHLAETELPRGLELSIGDRQAVLKPRLSEEAYARKLLEALSAHLPRDSQTAETQATAALDASSRGSKSRPISQALTPRYWVAASLIGIVVATSFWVAGRESRWARNEAIPAIEASLDTGNWEGAYALTQRAADAIGGDDPELEELWPRFSWLITSLTTDPPGASVLRRPYEGRDQNWQLLGVTPLEGLRLPFGMSEFRFELEGYEPVAAAAGSSSFGLKAFQVPTLKLDRLESIPEGKVRIPGWQADAAGKPTRFNDFFIGRYEVTNQEFKAFVDAGGYTRRELWEHPFVIDGEEIPWEEAVQRLTDTTGHYGPAGWEVGDYPAGQDEYPVTGVSWYEAAAYAKFVDQSLPTYYHWREAYTPETLAWVLPKSNVNASGPIRVGASGAMSSNGVYDVAGNAREWVFNAVGSERMILGGGWDATYGLELGTTAPPFDRSLTNGLRLAISQDETDVAERARAALPAPEVIDIRTIPPISEDTLAVVRAIYDYDRTPLNAVVEASESSRSWTRERVTFDAAYGDERMLLHLYLPASGTPPYQTIVYWPQIVALQLNSSDDYGEAFDFILKSGRAVAFPVLKGTLERGGGEPPAGSAALREMEIHRIKDLRRSLDYLETRPDIDASAFGFFGESWGAGNAPRALVLEPRLTVAVLAVPPVFEAFGALPTEIAQVPYLSRIDVPTIAFSGELDPIVPLKLAAVSFFELMGSAELEKRHVIEMSGHFAPRGVFIRESLDWLDKHLGPTD